MSLVPDYGSSSEEENNEMIIQQVKKENSPVLKSVKNTVINGFSLPAPAHSTDDKKSKKKKTRKKKTLFLPPEIQKLLESGALDDSDDEEMSKIQKKKVKRPRQTPQVTDDLSAGFLSSLPAPKNPFEIQLKQRHEEVQEKEKKEEEKTVSDTKEPSIEQQQQYDPNATTAYYYQYHHHHHQQQQQAGKYYYPTYDPSLGTGETNLQGKRARNRDRELERALQQGQFDRVADKIIDVQGPSPNGWERPVDVTKELGERHEQQVAASFWNSQIGEKVSTMRPSRLQRQRHQLNQLAFDAKAREFELAEKRGAGLKTKAETHAKYGW